LTIKCSNHTHELYSNPFAYKIHEKTSEYQQLVNKSLNVHIASVPYSVQRRVLDSDNLGITINARTYYNLVQNTRANKEEAITILGLLITLDDTGFHYHTRVEELFNDLGTVISQKLLQIWFIHLEAMRFTQ
jgi:CRISPR/Cas system-associated endonuclease Cas3-HD